MGEAWRTNKPLRPNPTPCPPAPPSTHLDGELQNVRERQVGEVDVGVVPVGHDGEDGGNHRHDTPMAQLHALQHRTGEECKPWVMGGGGEGGGGGGGEGETVSKRKMRSTMAKATTATMPA